MTTYKAQVLNTMHLSITLREKNVRKWHTNLLYLLKSGNNGWSTDKHRYGCANYTKFYKYTERTLLKSHKAKTVWV